MRYKRVRKYHSGGTRNGYYTYHDELDFSKEAKFIKKAVAFGFIEGMCRNAAKSEEQRKRDDELFFNASFKILAWLVPFAIAIKLLCWYVGC